MVSFVLKMDKQDIGKADFEETVKALNECRKNLPILQYHLEVIKKNMKIGDLNSEDVTIVKNFLIKCRHAPHSSNEYKYELFEVRTTLPFNFDYQSRNFFTETTRRKDLCPDDVQQKALDALGIYWDIRETNGYNCAY